MVIDFAMPFPVVANTDWSSLQHAAGQADDVPEAFLCLEGNDSEAREEAVRWLIDTCFYDENGQHSAYSASLPVFKGLAAFVDGDAGDEELEDLQADVADELAEFLNWASAGEGRLGAPEQAELRALVRTLPWLTLPEE